MNGDRGKEGTRNGKDSNDQPHGHGESFSYDQVGNRTDLGGVTGTGNRLQSFNGITFSHDADGNVTQKFRSSSEYRDYYWSAEARLDSAYHNSWSKVKYDYDALGRPVRKWRGDPNGWVFDRLWVYDGDHRVVSLDPSMNRVEEYAYAPGIDQPIATIRGNTGVDAVGYHVQDELGNILGIIENGAYISQTNSYDAWGTPTETGHAYNNQLKWKGLKWEGDVISLYYMRNRWYDYETGRFMSEDPIGLSGGINLYAFAGNDPVNGWDPYGLCDGAAAIQMALEAWARGEDFTWRCVDLPTVERTARGGSGGKGDRGSSWPRGGGDGSGGDLGGPGGGESSSGDKGRALITRECISSSAMLAITGVTDFTIVGPAARAGAQLGARAFTHVVSGLSFDVIRGAGYISKNQHRRLGGTAWGMATGYSSAAGIRAHTVANEAVGTVDLGLVSGDLSGWDFVPYLATLRSLDRAIRTCL